MAQGGRLFREIGQFIRGTQRLALNLQQALFDEAHGEKAEMREILLLGGQERVPFIFGAGNVKDQLLGARAAELFG